ncbi:hypothetical protein ACT691_01265 [Vibrio metschnikovii]
MRLSNDRPISMALKSDPHARVIGGGFQMLAQTAGTVSHPLDVGRCPDNDQSYRLYKPCQ